MKRRLFLVERNTPADGIRSYVVRAEYPALAVRQVATELALWSEHWVRVRVTSLRPGPVQWCPVHFYNLRIDRALGIVSKETP